jgi:hypothetical protein
VFDILRDILSTSTTTAANYPIQELASLLAPCAELDLAGDKYQAPGIGRSEIRKELKQAIGL